jgi:hypothetical protein
MFGESLGMVELKESGEGAVDTKNAMFGEVLGIVDLEDCTLLVGDGIHELGNGL